jgi:hypothetical protein
MERLWQDLLKKPRSKSVKLQALKPQADGTWIDARTGNAVKPKSGKRYTFVPNPKLTKSKNSEMRRRLKELGRSTHKFPTRTSPASPVRDAYVDLSTDQSSNDFPLAAPPLFAYIDSDDAESVMRFYMAVENFTATIGLDHKIETIERGSILLKFRTWWKNAKNKERLNDKLDEIVANAERYGKAQVDRAVAESDNLNANSLLQISQAAGDRDYAVVFEGFIACRITNVDGQVQMYRRLSAQEAMILEKNPRLLEKPQTLLAAIDEILKLNESIDPAGKAG